MQTGTSRKIFGNAREKFHARACVTHAERTSKNFSQAGRFAAGAKSESIKIERISDK
jgi:hypothetical protein